MKKLYIIFISLFLALIIVPTVLVFATEDKDFSDNENRVLQTAPELSAEKIADGAFQEELTSYISDQFPARDFWTQAGSKLKMAIGIRDIGGAYICDDDYYMEKKTGESLDMDKYSENMGYINDFAKTNPQAETTVVLVPTAASILADKLPSHAQSYDAAALLKYSKGLLPDCTVPNIVRLMQNNADSYIYYRTDHHWTSYGAGLVYRYLAGPTGAYRGDPQLFCEDFYGTTYSKTLDNSAKPDSVYLPYLPDGVKVKADGKSISMYDMDAANEKDKYKVFFGGNYGEVVISGGCGNGKTLLMIKDSYANSLVPYYVTDYETIVMLDLRYYNLPVREYAKKLNPTDIIVIGEIGNIAADDNLFKLSF